MADEPEESYVLVVPMRLTGPAITCSGCHAVRSTMKVRNTLTGAVIAYLCRRCVVAMAIALMETELG